MKNPLRNLLVSIAIIGAPLSTFADEKGSSPKATIDLPTYTIEDIAALPEPTRLSIPKVTKRAVGMKLNVKLTVDVNGKTPF